MLRLSFEILEKGTFGKSGINNLILEAFLLHARNLVDFFCNEKKYSDDIVALDFVGKKWEHGDILSEKIKQKEDNKPTRTINWYVGLNKQLSHITEGRSKEKTRTHFAREMTDGKLVFIEIYKGLLKIVHEFNKLTLNHELKIKPK
jgi:hypothetical protein